MGKLIFRPWSLVFVFALLYLSISLVNHWCFRTYSLDLGAYTSALYDYAHFSFHDCTSFKSEAENILSGHFDLYLMLFSPLSWIFGVYTLLLVQVLAILLGGWGIYRLMQPYGTSNAVLAAAYFYSFFGIVAAVSFDYHSNVVAACLVPWLFISIRDQKLKQFIILFLFIIVARENLSLLLFVLLPCTLVVYPTLAPAFKKWIWMAATFSLVYFVLVSAVVMPALSNTGKMYQFRYSVLGESYGDALKNLALHPVDSFTCLFRNHSGNSQFDFIKAELWIYLLLSGLVLFVFNWPFVVMLFPVLAQKLFHDQPEMWGINDHYSAELAPIMTIGVFYTLHKMRLTGKGKNIVAYSLVVLSLVLTVHMMDSPVSLVRRDNIRVYNAQHYQPVVDPQAFETARQLIPNNTIVSCQSLLHPHFSWRDKAYTFPTVKDAKYIILFTKESFYPLAENAYYEKVNALKQDQNWEILFDKEGLMVLKRKRYYLYNEFD